MGLIQPVKSEVCKYVSKMFIGQIIWLLFTSFQWLFKHLSVVSVTCPTPTVPSQPFTSLASSWMFLLLIPPQLPWLLKADNVLIILSPQNCNTGWPSAPVFFPWHPSYHALHLLNLSSNTISVSPTLSILFKMQATQPEDLMLFSFSSITSLLIYSFFSVFKLYYLYTLQTNCSFPYLHSPQHPHL